jgi:hypothetical protein
MRAAILVQHVVLIFRSIGGCEQPDGTDNESKKSVLTRMLVA